MSAHNRRRPNRGRTFTIEEYSECRGVHPDTVRNWIRQGKITARKRGNQPNDPWLILVDDPTDESPVGTLNDLGPVTETDGHCTLCTTRQAHLESLERHLALLERHVELQQRTLDTMSASNTWRRPA
ncbi:MAG: hypothetical protein F2659_00220 [Actinobacteria bacterium]|uniref:Unannotated protein n=1 Tax=freshwater metagenome TaxID=449393 RepID=A0A6J6XSU2_9ZZZZ|nr:hypothetical protein [Actinomycetota bacterium]MSY18662.1 hypothetical protein [Actinomycetota bacterium]MSY75667.1 hypothetical protein [Actinomycetota bacterium]